MRWAFGIAALLGVAGPASAAWMQAQSRHFIVYADEKPEALQRRVADLELLDAGLRLMHRVDEVEGAEANRLTIYVTHNLDDLKRIYGDADSMVAGFYEPRAAGSIAFTPAIGYGTDRTDLSPQTVLYHEYAHHFLLGNVAVAYPAWFTEGYAELVSTVKVDETGLVVGAPALHRVDAIFGNDGLSVEGLFAPPKRMDSAQVLSLYGRGWALTHYLMMDAERSKQLSSYLAAFNAGTPSITAARAAFGDLRALNHALNDYVLQRRLPARTIPRARLKVDPVTIRPLSAGETALLDTRMRSVRGVNEKTVEAIFAAGSKAARRFPDDAVVQGWLAEMGYDAKHDAEAEQAADRALTLDPNQTQALLYKARLRLRAVAKGIRSDANWANARSFIVRVNKRSANDAQALTLFYQSYLIADQKPTPNAVAALVRAQELLPQAPDLRFMLVRQYIHDGQLADARRTLLPLAYDPHVAPDSVARKLLDAIDAKADVKTLEALMAAREKKPGEDTDSR